MSRKPDDTTPMLPAVEGEYATPPEEPDRNTPEPDWLAKAARQHESGWTTGYVEGAVGELAALARARVRLAAAPRRQIDALIVERLTGLWARFGVTRVGDELRKVIVDLGDLAATVEPP